MLAELHEFRPGDVAGFSLWPDAGTKKGFAGIDIADAYDHLAVHDVLLDGCLAVFAAGREIAGIKVFLQWFGSKVLQEGVSGEWLRGMMMPKNRAKTPWVMEPHFHVTLESKDEVVVFLQFRVSWAYAQTPRHAQMQNEGAGGGSQKDVFGSALDTLHHDPFKGVDLIFNGPAHSGLPDFYILDATTRNVGLNSSAGCLDFG